MMRLVKGALLVGCGAATALWLIGQMVKGVADWLGFTDWYRDGMH